MDLFIVDTARKNLDIALRLDKSTFLPDPGWRWQAYRSTALKWVNYFRTPIEVIHAIQSPSSNMGYEARMTGRKLVDYARTSERACLSIFPDYDKYLGSFIESPLSHPSTLTVMNGRIVSSPLYNHVVQIMRCTRFVHPRIVMEIGGGYGAPGRLWMTNQLNPIQMYIDVDFPESLYFAEIYFRANDHNLTIEYIHSSDDIERAMLMDNDEKKVMLVPISQMGSLNDIQIDLLINTGSLQEMTPAYVDFYMDWIDSSKADFFYSANYFGQKIDALMEGMNYGAPFLGKSWNTLFCGLHQDPFRPVAELLFKHSFEAAHPTESYCKRVQLLLQTQDPMPLSVFLELFDISRKIGDPAVLLNIVDRSLRMQHIPKEALKLARHGLSMAIADYPNNPQLVKRIETLLVFLTEMAAKGQSRMGIVDGTVANLRDKIIASKRGGITLEELKGCLVETTEGTEIEVAGRVRSLRIGTFGAVERYEVNVNNVIISGWTKGISSSDRVIRIHFFLDGWLADTTVPTLVRPEFELGDKLIGFNIDSVIPAESAQGKHYFVVAEFEDGTLGKLTNGGDIEDIDNPKTA